MKTSCPFEKIIGYFVNSDEKREHYFSTKWYPSFLVRMNYSICTNIFNFRYICISALFY